MARYYDDWLGAYVDFARFTEAPTRMHFWSAVSTVAGALRRRVWLDQHYFKWYANLYIILVAPPGVVSKSTTADMATSILREIEEPKIGFGPSVVTWQALVQAHASHSETFFEPGTGQLMVTSPLTIVSSELGNLLNPDDREQVDMLVNLWDGKSFDKLTKGGGAEYVTNPWLNIIAATTPDWIAGAFPKYMIGGGFTSRCLFVFADTKQQYIAYPGMVVPKDIDQHRARLKSDLEHIARNLLGEYKMTPEAIEAGEDWYKKHWTVHVKEMDQKQQNAAARKQTQIHKLAMVMAASRRDELIITAEDIIDSTAMVTNLELEAAQVFEKVGAHADSLEFTRLLAYIQRKGGEIPAAEAYSFLSHAIPYKNDQQNGIDGLIASGKLLLLQTAKGFTFKLT